MLTKYISKNNNCFLFCSVNQKGGNLCLHKIAQSWCAVNTTYNILVENNNKKNTHTCFIVTEDVKWTCEIMYNISGFFGTIWLATFKSMSTVEFLIFFLQHLKHYIAQIYLKRFLKNFSKVQIFLNIQIQVKPHFYFSLFPCF